MEFKKVNVTPLIATNLLAKNESNRKVNEKTVNQYYRDMMEGRWKEETAEVIKISQSGRVLDGQHRLLAIIKSNKAFTFHIAYGLDDSIFDVLDTGKVRSASDVLNVQNIQNSSNIAAIIKSYLVIKAGTSVDTKGVKTSNKVILDAYMEKPEHWQSVHSFSIKIYSAFSKIIPISTIGSFYNTFYDLSPIEAREFFNQLSTGEGIKNETISTLRKVLLKDRLATRKMPSSMRNAIIIKSWNACRKGLAMRALRFDADVEKYPKAI